MKKTFLLCAQLLFLAFTANAQEQYPNSYYITLKGDTIKATIIYTDIIDQQYRLEILDSCCTHKILYPTEIKQVCINGGHTIIPFAFGAYKDDYTDGSEIDRMQAYSINLYTTNRALLKSAFTPIPKTDTLLHFSSVHFNDGHALFIHVLSGLNDTLMHMAYYYRVLYHFKNYDGPFNSHIDFLVKNNMFMHKPRHTRYFRWLASTISDDTFLARLVKNRELDINNPSVGRAYPDLNMIVTEYNRWLSAAPAHKHDTTPTIRGILDADKYYHPKWVTPAVAAAGTAEMFPGLIVGACMNREPNAAHLKIPTNTAYCQNPEYVYAYKQRAMYKKSRAIMNGVWMGVALCICALTIDVLLNPNG